MENVECKGQQSQNQYIVMNFNKYAILQIDIIAIRKHKCLKVIKMNKVKALNKW